MVCQKEMLKKIHGRLVHGLPITQEQTRWLYYVATGERIRMRKRCDRCNAEGCELCGGSGYAGDLDSKTAKP